MINLSGPNITHNSVNRWKIKKFDYDTGIGSIEVQSAGGAQTQEFAFALSDVAGRSTGVKVNPTPLSWNDRFLSSGGGPAGGGMGLVNSLTNARAAYDAAGGSHANKVKAVELQAIVDQWVDSLMAGS